MKKWLLILLFVICVGAFILAFVLLNPRENIEKLNNTQDDSIIQNGTIVQSGRGEFLLGDAMKLVQRDVYILVDYTDDKLYHNSYLVIKEESEALIYNLSESGIGSYGDWLYVCDIDGDGADEIVVQRTIGMTGGAGQYVSQIFKIENNKITEIFHSSPTNKFDTGFSSKLMDNYVFVVVNRFTNYEKQVDISNKNNYLGIFYNDEGKVIREESLFTDSFNTFSPVDIDKDGIFEIKICQYTSLYGHSDYVGTAVSVLKYRGNTKEFEIIETKFELGDASAS